MPWNFIFGITTVVCLVAFVLAMVDLKDSSRRRNMPTSHSRYEDYFIDNDGVINYIKHIDVRV